jgi:hypothetical protein
MCLANPTFPASEGGGHANADVVQIEQFCSDLKEPFNIGTWS